MSIEADWIIAIATAGATFVSIVATCIAKKSASASQNSAQVAEKILRRSLIRELITECNLLVAEELRIQSIVIELRANTITIGTGCIDPDNWYKKDLNNVAGKTIEAKSILENQEKLLTASDSDLDLKLTQIQTTRVELQTIRESMLRSLKVSKS